MGDRKRIPHHPRWAGFLSRIDDRQRSRHLGRDMHVMYCALCIVNSGAMFLRNMRPASAFQKKEGSIDYRFDMRGAQDAHSDIT
jgi:hypothetical protein